MHTNFDLDPFQVDVKNVLQALLDGSSSFAEFCVESEAASVFINAGEVDPATFFQIDTRFPGPKLVLGFDQNAVVPEPSTILLLGFAGIGFFWLRRLKLVHNWGIGELKWRLARGPSLVEVH